MSNGQLSKKLHVRMNRSSAAAAGTFVPTTIRLPRDSCAKVSRIELTGLSLLTPNGWSSSPTILSQYWHPLLNIYVKADGLRSGSFLTNQFEEMGRTDLFACVQTSFGETKDTHTLQTIRLDSDPSFAEISPPTRLQTITVDVRQLRDGEATADGVPAEETIASDISSYMDLFFNLYMA